MRKILLCLLAVCFLSGCAPARQTEPKLKVCATLFPQYDFCRQIAGDKAEVTLLLPPGMESHNYEPSVSDILTVAESDLFFYTGPYMEPWAQTVIDGLDSSVQAVDVSQNITLCAHEEHEGHEEHEHEEHAPDPHIWTDPHLAAVMAETVALALCEADAENSGYYMARLAAYREQLQRLDAEFSDAAEALKNRTLCHGGRFSMTYFARRYGLHVVAAFDSCASQAEPSARRVVSMIETMKEEKLPAVFYEEMTEPKIARVIAEETGADMLLLHSCHNVTKRELEAGSTYLSLMQGNLKNLQEYGRRQQACW